jgi:hypothetical protein
MRHSDHPTAQDEGIAARYGQRFIGGLLSSLALGVTTLLTPHDPRRPEEVPGELPCLPAREIGAGSAWGVGG